MIPRFAGDPTKTPRDQRRSPEGRAMLPGRAPAAFPAPAPPTCRRHWQFPPRPPPDSPTPPPTPPPPPPHRSSTPPPAPTPPAPPPPPPHPRLPCSTARIPP